MKKMFSLSENAAIKYLLIFLPLLCYKISTLARDGRLSLVAPILGLATIAKNLSVLGWGSIRLETMLETGIKGQEYSGQEGRGTENVDSQFG